MFTAHGEATQCGWDSLRFVAAENGSSARVLTMTAALMFADVKIVLYQVAGGSVANRRRRRWTAPNRFTLCRFSRREQSPPQPHRRHSRTSAHRAAGRRPVRGARSRGKSGFGRGDRRRRRFATGAPATWLSTRCSRSCGSTSRRRHRQHARGRAVFPRRRTGEFQPTPSSLRPRCGGEPTLRTC